MTYKRYVTIEDSRRVVISDVPFRPGQRVEVVMIAEDEESASRLQELKQLLQATHGLPPAQALTEDDIASEIETYRAGR